MKPGELIFIVGPSGSGKTTVRRNEVSAFIGNPLHWGTGRLPAIEVFALLPKNAYFSSFGLAKSLYRQLFVPDLRWLGIDGSNANPAIQQFLQEIRTADQAINSVALREPSETKIWERFQSMATARSLRLACIDQAAAMCINHKNTSPAEHILHLMSIAEQSAINFVFSGVHHTALLWNTRPEIFRRSKIVWVLPYSHTRKEDRDPFLALLRTLGNRYAFSKPRLLFSMSADILAATGGVYGNMDKLLFDASERAQQQGRTVIHRSDIEDAIPPDAELTQLWRDIQAFEALRTKPDVKTRAAAISTHWRLRENAPAESQHAGPHDVAEATS
jgi:hypothetical protein